MYQEKKKIKQCFYKIILIYSLARFDVMTKLFFFYSTAPPNWAIYIYIYIYIAQLGGAIEYTDCTSVGGKTSPPNECPRYDTKQSDGEVPVIYKIILIYILARFNDMTKTVSNKEKF